MSKRVLAAVLALLFLVTSGCGTADAPPEGSEGGKIKSTEVPEAAKTEPPEQVALSKVLEEIIAEAPEGCVLAIIRRPELPRFAALGQPSLTMDASERYPGLISETVLLVPLLDGISIEVEYFELHPTLPWRLGNEVLYQIEAKIGECYALNTYLAETMPSMSVTAGSGGLEAVWNCTMDGRGDLELEYLPPPEPPQEDSFASAPYVASLSGAKALCWTLFGDDGFWQTVAYGIAQTETAYAYEDTGNGRKITLSRDRFFSYVETLFPGLTVWPPWEGSEAEDYFSCNQADDSYEVAYFELPEIENWRVWDFEEDADGKGGALIVMVRNPGIIPYQRAVEVIWREKKLRAENDPIAFEIIELRDVRYNLEVDTEHYKHFMEQGSWAQGMEPEARIDNYLIVDLDNDGVAELLLTASDDSCEISALYVIDHWETKELLRGELSGGSIGGERVILARDLKSGLTVAGLAGHAGGFGGAAQHYNYYNYAAGDIEHIIHFNRIEYFDDETPVTYAVDGEEATAEEYAALEARFELIRLME